MFFTIYKSVQKYDFFVKKSVNCFEQLTPFFSSLIHRLIASSSHRLIASFLVEHELPVLHRIHHDGVAGAYAVGENQLRHSTTLTASAVLIVETL